MRTRNCKLPRVHNLAIARASALAVVLSLSAICNAGTSVSDVAGRRLELRWADAARNILGVGTAYVDGSGAIVGDVGNYSLTGTVVDGLLWEFHLVGPDSADVLDVTDVSWDGGGFCGRFQSDGATGYLYVGEVGFTAPGDGIIRDAGLTALLGIGVGVLLWQVIIASWRRKGEVL